MLLGIDLCVQRDNVCNTMYVHGPNDPGIWLQNALDVHETLPVDYGTLSARLGRTKCLNILSKSAQINTHICKDDGDFIIRTFFSFERRRRGNIAYLELLSKIYIADNGAMLKAFYRVIHHRSGMRYVSGGN